MIALTKEKREELTKFAKATLNSFNGIEPENPNQYDDCLSEYTQKCMEIALASLTEVPKVFAWEVPKFRGSSNRVTELCQSNSEGAYPLFTSPPVPEIKRPDLLDIPDGLDLESAMAAINWYETETKRLNGLGE